MEKKITRISSFLFAGLTLCSLCACSDDNGSGGSGEGESEVQAVYVSHDFSPSAGPHYGAGTALPSYADLIRRKISQIAFMVLL